MAAKKSRARKATMDKYVAKGIKAGRALAAEAVKERARERKTRNAAVKHSMLRTRAAAAPKIPRSTREALGSAGTAGLLIAEGDSWFDYPLRNVLTKLEDLHGYDVDSVAHNGDCVEDMAYSGAQFSAFSRQLEKRLRDGKVPRAVLLSGGGNDIAGTELAIMFNHSASLLEVVNRDVVRGVIDVRLRAAYASIIAGVTAIARHYLGRPLPIVIHGYAHPVADGRGYLGGWWKLPGPWLKPGFDQKGYRDPNTRELVGELIDRFNSMLVAVAASPGFSHVHYLDLRDVLPNDSTYKTYWANELHPTVRGFELVAAEFSKVIGSLPPA